MKKELVMGSFNKVILMGNLTRDPELKQLPSGSAVADMRLAVSEKYKNKQGEAAESVCFVDVVAWGRQAEICGQYLAKGSPVLIDGRLQYDSWENEDGQRRSKIKVQASRVQFVSGRSSSRNAGGVEGEPAPEAHDAGDDLPF
jgi:single-strand DNA-binding protein